MLPPVPESDRRQPLINRTATWPYSLPIPLTLYVIKRISGVWQSRVAWNKTTGNLSGVAAVYDGDWKLLVSGKDASGNFKLWSLVYGDGGEVTAGTWSDLKEIATAPSDGGSYEFTRSLPGQAGSGSQRYLPLFLHRKIQRQRSLQPALSVPYSAGYRLPGKPLAGTGALRDGKRQRPGYGPYRQLRLADLPFRSLAGGPGTGKPVT